MTNNEILAKAVDKAIERGWRDKRGVLARILVEGMNDDARSFAAAGIMFNQDFGEAFFAKDLLICSFCKRSHKVREDCDVGGFEKQLPAYQYHQQQMVILTPDERFQYLKKFL